MAEEPLTEGSEDERKTISYQRKKPSRKPLPKNLPREEVLHDVKPEEKQCECGCEKQRIGEEVSEQLEVIPVNIKVVAHIRPKYACNRCDNKISIAPMPQLFLPKHIASSSLISYTIINKFQDHLPLYRQEQMWKRLDVDIPRNTMSNWIIKAYEICMLLKEVFIK